MVGRQRTSHSQVFESQLFLSFSKCFQPFLGRYDSWVPGRLPHPVDARSSDALAWPAAADPAWQRLTAVTVQAAESLATPAGSRASPRPQRGGGSGGRNAKGLRKAVAGRRRSAPNRGREEARGLQGTEVTTGPGAVGVPCRQGRVRVRGAQSERPGDTLPSRRSGTGGPGGGKHQGEAELDGSSAAL